MPRQMERRLRREAQRKFPGDRERQDAYVYGTMTNQGWRPNRWKPKPQPKADQRGETTS